MKVFPELGDQPFYDAGEILVASDSKASRIFAFVRRNADGNVELFSRRDGPSGQLYTLLECRETGPVYCLLAEGEDILDLAANRAERHQVLFSGLTDGSMADVKVRHAISAMREIELKSGN